jgi:hypothetical protein
MILLPASYASLSGVLEKCRFVATLAATTDEHQGSPNGMATKTAHCGLAIKRPYANPASSESGSRGDPIARSETSVASGDAAP